MLREVGLEQGATMVRPEDRVAGDVQWLRPSRRCPATIKPLRPPAWERCTDEGVPTASPDHKHFMVSLIVCL